MFLRKCVQLIKNGIVALLTLLCVSIDLELDLFIVLCAGVILGESTDNLETIITDKICVNQLVCVNVNCYFLCGIEILLTKLVINMEVGRKMDNLLVCKNNKFSG